MVDDHPGNLLALEAILGPLGHEMVRADSAADAFKHLIDGDFAVILMDVQMPEMDGFAAAALIKSRDRTRAIPIIFITALSRDDAFVFQGYEHGAVDYILKPFEPVILRSKVAVFVELYQQRQQIDRQGKLLLEADRQRSDRRYRALGDGVPVALCLASSDGRVEYCNDRMLETCGVSQAEMSRAGWIACVHVEDREEALAAWHRAVETKQRAEVEFRMHCGHQTRWQLGSIVPDASDERGATFIIAATDIDVQKRAQQAAERANVLKDEFLATVSHELRTPLNAILGWSEALVADTLDEERTRHALDAIARNARAQAELVGDILDASRIVTGKLTLHLAELSLPMVIEAALDVVRAAAEAKGIELTTRFDDEGCFVRGDENRLKQVVWNLASNAVKFTPKGGRVQVRLRHVGGELELAIIDDGGGIAPEFLPFVFDRFRQADSSSTRSHGGLGLGLSIVKQLVELHGGEVRAESDGVGKGARFIVVLPTTSHVERARVKTPAATSTAPLVGRDVLIVDDDIDGRQLLELVFARKGARVQTASSVAEAFERIAATAPALIISDIGMPVEDGYSFLRRLRKSGSTIPAIALTGFARDDDAERVREVGFDAHMAKPVESAQLVALAVSLVSRR